MGVDARIVVEVNEEHVSPQKLLEWHGGLCRTFDVQEFFFSREEGRGCIHLTEDIDESVGDGKVYYQDGPDIHAPPGKLFLTIDIYSRYYGPGYERGDCLLICGIAEWCEINIPSCRVFYGGDSSGVLLELFDAEARAKLRAHFYSLHGRDYFASSFFKSQTKPDVSDCKLCTPNYVPVQYGSGPGYAAYHCAVCGYYFETRDSGITWTTSSRRPPL